MASLSELGRIDHEAIVAIRREGAPPPYAFKRVGVTSVDNRATVTRAHAYGTRA
jgi:hypothetical protein